MTFRTRVSAWRRIFAALMLVMVIAPLSALPADASSADQLTVRVNSPKKGETVSGFIMGSFDYMAPEQADDPHAVDARADLYSLGCTLYHLLAGQPPFRSLSQSPLATIKAHAHEAPPPLESRRSDVPPRLGRLVSRLLAKQRDQRPDSAATVARELGVVQRAVPAGPGGTWGKRACTVAN